MQRSVSRDHLPSNQESPSSTQNHNPSPPPSQSLSSFNNQNFHHQNNHREESGPSQLSICWKVTFIVSSVFANGIAAASLLYIWKFCDC
jgi:hypothetical protein